MTNVTDFNSYKNKDKELTTTPKLIPGDYEIHFFPYEDDPEGKIVKTRGYLKFSPQFIAVVDGPDEVSTVSFCCQTNLVHYIKRVDDQGIQATLSL